MEVKQATRGENPARFQRTEQWRPVYSWLESLDTDEVIKSKDIADWLATNPEVNEQLGSRHSRYHLTHYIKKCHMKILKRKGVQLKSSEPAPLVVEPLNMLKEAAAIPSNPVRNVAKDNRDLYQFKHQEALRKFEILVELEKQLDALVSKKNTEEES
ncbi:unnamed protein product [Amaranthus hypochondriacus]